MTNLLPGRVPCSALFGLWGQSEEEMEREDHISLKWGTLKAWHLNSEKGKELLKRYFDLGTSAGAMTANDTPEQKDLICQMIDECSAPTIWLDWDGVEVSKEEAKRYVLDYGKKAASTA